MAYSNNHISLSHSNALNIINFCIDILTASIKFCSVHMHYKWFAAYSFGGNSSQVCKPVMRMNDIKIVSHCNLSGYECISCHLLHKVGPVLTGKFIFFTNSQLEILNLSLLKVRHHLSELLGVYVRNHIGADSDKLNLFQKILNIAATFRNLNVTCVNNFHRSLIFVSCCGRHNKKHLYIIIDQTFGKAVTCSSKPSGYVWWEFPAEH